MRPPTITVAVPLPIGERHCTANSRECPMLRFIGRRLYCLAFRTSHAMTPLRYDGDGRPLRCEACLKAEKSITDNPCGHGTCAHIDKPEEDRPCQWCAFEEREAKTP